MTPRVPDERLDFARKLRRGMSTAEALVWRGIRGRGIGAKFLRQVPIGPYVADFACVALRLIVEIDGPTHEAAERQAADGERDRGFAEHGWRVLRIPNDLVMGGGDLVMGTIKTMLGESPHPTLANAKATFSRETGEGTPQPLDDHT